VRWYIITDIDVLGDSSSKTIVALGDSITDGYVSTLNGAEPLAGQSRQAAGHQRAHGGCLRGQHGHWRETDLLVESALQRALASIRDVLDQSGVQWLILFEGNQRHRPVHRSLGPPRWLPR